MLERWDMVSFMTTLFRSDQPQPTKTTRADRPDITLAGVSTAGLFVSRVRAASASLTNATCDHRAAFHFIVPEASRIGLRSKSQPEAARFNKSIG